MLKVIGLMKRNPAMSLQQFIDYYETTHARLGEKYLRKTAKRYIRRFLHPVIDPFAETVLESDYDAILEMWFENQEQWQTTLAQFADPGAMAEIVADEERVFDRARNRFFIVEEHESDLTAP